MQTSRECIFMLRMEPVVSVLFNQSRTTAFSKMSNKVQQIALPVFDSSSYKCATMITGDRLRLRYSIVFGRLGHMTKKKTFNQSEGNLSFLEAF